MTVQYPRTGAAPSRPHPGGRRHGRSAIPTSASTTTALRDAPALDARWPGAWTANASPSSARASSRSIPGSRARRPRRSAARSRWGRTTSCSRPSASSRPRSCAASTPSSTSPYHRGTWHGGPYDPRATRFGPICIPSPPRSSTRSAYAMGPEAGRHARGVTVAYFGDGSASEGDFHEGANLAGVLAGPADPVLPEQRLGDQRAHRAADRRGDLASAPRATASRACASTATTCWPCTGHDAGRRSARTPARARP